MKDNEDDTSGSSGSHNINRPTWLRLMDGDANRENILEILFKIDKRGSSIQTEVYGGLCQFLAMASIIAVNPSLLESAGYDRQLIASATCVACGFTCILMGLVGNFPFVCAPSFATAIYLSVYLQTNQIDMESGNVSVFILGLLLMFCGIRVVNDVIYWYTPMAIKLGICIGLSLLVSLEALTQLGLVVPGQYTVVSLGDVWSTKSLIAMTSFAFIGILLHHGFKGAYVIGLFVGSLAYWLIQNDFPTAIMSTGSEHPLQASALFTDDWSDSTVWTCAIELCVISVVKLTGLSVGLSELAGLNKSDGSGAPRRRWLYVACGLGTCIGALFGSGPVLLVVESAAGILVGARTGLSAIVCGFLFFGAYFFHPLFAAIPIAATGPVLLNVGMLLFHNTGKVNWNVTKEALPVFITAVFTAFTFSVIHGVTFGVAIYLILTLATGDTYSVLRSTHQHPAPIPIPVPSPTSNDDRGLIESLDSLPSNGPMNHYNTATTMATPVGSGATMSSVMSYQAIHPDSGQTEGWNGVGIHQDCAISVNNSNCASLCSYQNQHVSDM